MVDELFGVVAAVVRITRLVVDAAYQTYRRRRDVARRS